MKFAFSTDTHLCSRRPINRIDEHFFETQLTKLDFIIDKSIEAQVEVFFHGGDLFDTPSLPDFSLLNNVLPRFCRLKRAKIEAYIVLGSHDMFGYNKDSVNKTAVGSLIHAGVLKVLEGPITIKNTLFYGIPATLNHSVTTYKDVPENAIVITHNTLVPIDTPFEHVLIKDIPNRRNLFLCGHYHVPFHRQLQESTFINIGPLIRTEKTEYKHNPMLLVGTVEPNKILNIQNVPVPHGTDVFDLTDTFELASTFVHTLQTTRIDFYDLFDLTRQLAKTNNIPEHITNQALLRLENANSSING